MDPLTGQPEDWQMLAQIGISTGAVGSSQSQGGRLTLDETAFQAKRESDPELNQELLGVGGLVGVLGRMFNRSGDGLLASL